MVDEHYIDYSQLLAQLLDKDGELNETTVSFLYHLFPSDFFVRAMSLIDSNNMFIYVFERDETSAALTTSVGTEPDEVETTTETLRTSPSPPVASEQELGNAVQSSALINTLYEKPQSVLHRLIVKQEGPQSPPVCVDLRHWFCSCDEYNTLFEERMLTDEEPSLYSKATTELRAGASITDSFASMPPKGASRRYFRHDIIMCPHLLAFAILLQTTPELLTYFTHKAATVYLITIQNLDEWLKLHLNVVI
ncbi:Suppressor of hydroxyurea sensitivity protein 2 [Lachancea thermotolerans]|uniref:Suppressor of hydroxyurea sensitivity protein 2 n=1 Tax=Lachancea thermotolerans (strain ATCC 56472 / CBS 6340 / NRRL Y-8284) TaxID=559295 RepID=SHU2_LACTC|nr:KLTH0H07348p [Lachancea thermotolerans CBS 6340]C5E2S6.1 RecName: Full=Suppressor of hydroxyurea sensitivity protein 2 [Lachancea thermotolerans CBS 6340]CAR30337.1 KLTH0H07348p [Lachancea thermotolerans CBS 6340]